MLLYIAEHLRDDFGWLNLIRYVSFRTMAAFITSLVVFLLLYPSFMRFLKTESVGQVIRDDIAHMHFSKEGTPTMGGVLILFSIVLSSVLWTQLLNPLVLLALGFGISFGLIGFFDDFKKLRFRSSKGLSGKVRLISEFAIVFIGMFIFLKYIGPKINYDLKLYLPFVSVEKFYIELPFVLYLVLTMFVIVGTANACNLTDGMDGLATGPILTGSGTFLILTYITGAKLGSFDISVYLLIPKVIGAQELAVVCSAMMGASIGFLYYNAYPAEIFMGDTGALAQGGLLGSMAVLSKNEILSIIVFGVFFFEAVSVILQTTYFKLTGKRIFRMAPLHHGLELMGWKEPKIVVRFWIISILLSMIALSSIKVR